MDIVGKSPAPTIKDRAPGAVIGEKAGIPVWNKVEWGHIACIEKEELKRKQKKRMCILTGRGCLCYTG